MSFDQDLSALATELGVPVPVGANDADKLIAMLQKLKDLVDDHETRIYDLENP